MSIIRRMIAENPEALAAALAVAVFMLFLSAVRADWLRIGRIRRRNGRRQRDGEKKD